MCANVCMAFFFLLFWYTYFLYRFSCEVTLINSPYHQGVAVVLLWKPVVTRIFFFLRWWWWCDDPPESDRQFRGKEKRTMRKEDEEPRVNPHFSSSSAHTTLFFSFFHLSLSLMYCVMVDVPIHNKRENPNGNKWLRGSASRSHNFFYKHTQ